MRRALAMAVLLVAGCGGGDPALSRLPSGWEVMAYTAGDKGVHVKTPPDTGIARGGFVMLDPGAKLLVIADESGEASDPLRRVRARILEGEYNGLVGEVSRENLRPLSR